MKVSFFRDLVVTNPKRHADSSDEDRLFPYYAGYSPAFTTKLLKSAGLDRDATVLDPWNGAGTTLQAAYSLGLSAVGVDLNPVMVIVAKAALLSSGEAPSLVPLAESIVDQCADYASDDIADPMTKWVDEEGAKSIRVLEASINRILVSREKYTPLTTVKAVEQIAPLAAFFYVALFRALRRLLRDFIPSNPTWTKTPKSAQERKRPRPEVINKAFIHEVRQLIGSLAPGRTGDSTDVKLPRVLLSGSNELPLLDNSADFALSSPPYCTRIDYAVATAIELAALRYDGKSFDSLRRSLMGTSTVERHGRACLAEWGETAAEFLDELYAHPSKASKGYYYKSHLQYFDSLYKSVVELHRVLKKGAGCVLVVQDSHYKEIHNDVPTILCEMAESEKFKLQRRENFVGNRSMVRMNSRAKKYLKTRQHVESVLCFEKT
jgi:DNA modification methylase